MSRRFALPAQAPLCGGAELEYRVGTPLMPEPSWWSATALDLLTTSDPKPGRIHEQWAAPRLRGEIAVLKAMLAERDRAARWRRELGRYDVRVERD